MSTTSVALALILGGALGNLYDRIHLHFVIDFLEVHILSYHWPDFNIADSAIVTGACLLLLEALRPSVDSRHKGAVTDESELSRRLHAPLRNVCQRPSVLDSSRIPNPLLCLLFQ